MASLPSRHTAAARGVWRVIAVQVMQMDGAGSGFDEDATPGEAGYRNTGGM